MSSELSKKLENYRKAVTEELDALKEERTELLDKLNKGEALTWKENKRNQKLAKLINEKYEILSLFAQYDLCVSTEKDFKEIVANTINVKDTTKFVNNLVKKLENIKDKNSDIAVSIDGLTEEELKDLEKTKIELETDIKDLENVIKYLEKKNLVSFKEEKELEKKKELLNEINTYISNDIDMTSAKADLTKAVKAKDKKEKNALLKKYKNYVKEAKDNVTNEITAEMNNGISLKDKTKATLAKTSEVLKNNAKKIAIISGIVVSVIAISAAAKSCSRNNENEKNPVGIENEYNDNKQLIEELMNYGIDKNTAFQYATTDGFNIDYLNDYEAARTKYAITASEAVDYVNRAHEIAKTNFYEGASIEQIVEVVMVINDNELFMSENSALEQSINASLTDVYNNYAFENISLENDINRMEALKHFAKENTGLDKFLTKFSNLTINVLSTKDDATKNAEAKNEMYNFLDTFANTFAGNTQDVNIKGNEEAVLEDTYEWNTAYHISSSLYSMFITEDKINEWICLQVNLRSNYEQWAQVNGCELGESRTLGGE